MPEQHHQQQQQQGTAAAAAATCDAGEAGGGDADESVGAAALLQLREDAELLRTMLALADEGEVADAEEARREGAAAAALCVAVDAVIGAMPQPDGE